VASNQIPDAMARRHLLEKSLDAKQAIALADAYLEQGRVVEAIDFLAKAEASDRLESLVEPAIEAGDAFLFRAILEAQGVEESSPEHWQRLLEAAEAAGKTLYASLARQALTTPESD